VIEAPSFSKQATTDLFNINEEAYQIWSLGNSDEWRDRYLEKVKHINKNHKKSNKKKDIKNTTTKNKTKQNN
jgi:hypothetical protein